MQRKIIHIDMDAFFASVEQLDNPDLRGKPIVVGGTSTRGVVAAASYEARKYGVRSAMPSSIAIRKCPHLIFVKHRFDRYKEISAQIRKIFLSYTDLVEPLSLDEAFLDVTSNKKEINSAIKIAMLIRQEIYDQTGLTASAGVSVNKFLAKIASDINKPNGLKVILPEEVKSFIEELPVGKFFGVGKATEERMKSYNIHTGKDLLKLDKISITQKFGKFGIYLFNAVRGQDNRAVKPSRIRKSFSIERTFSENIVTTDGLRNKIRELSEKLLASSSKKSIFGKTIQLKLRFGDFETFTRSKTYKEYIKSSKVISDTTIELTKTIVGIEDIAERGVRLVGIGFGKLNTEEKDSQLSLDF